MGTPAKRQLSISRRIATKVSTFDEGLTFGSSTAELPGGVEAPEPEEAPEPGGDDSSPGSSGGGPERRKRKRRG